MGLAVLLVEDDARFAKRLCSFLQKEGYVVEHATSGADGIRAFEAREQDVVLLDLILPDMSGLEALERIKAVNARSSVMVMTAHASIDSAVEAMRLGARDYITKPIDLEALCLKLEQNGQVLGLRQDLDYLLDRERAGGALESLAGESPPMQMVRQKIRDVAATDNTTVLITGESGTGKQLVAKAVHEASARANKPLMQIDCTAIPLSLLESELFGHERGAFTGADRSKKGLLELADRGTVFLDEIGDMEYGLQGKFLRVLQERQLRRVGGTRDLIFDVRVIAATHQDLESLCEERKFRQDLLFRLKVFEVRLPPLRDRGRDIVLLARRFAEQFAREFRKELSGLDASAERALLGYSFPGNVRELKNIIEQAVILERTRCIQRDSLSIRQDGSQRPVPEPPRADGLGGIQLSALGDSPLVTVERELIRQAMRESEGNKKKAARLLGITRFALQRKLEKMTLELLDLGQL